MPLLKLRQTSNFHVLFSRKKYAKMTFVTVNYVSLRLTGVWLKNILKNTYK